MVFTDDIALLIPHQREEVLVCREDVAAHVEFDHRQGAMERVDLRCTIAQDLRVMTDIIWKVQ